MKRFFNWLVVSSNDPQKVALTVKGIGVACVPFAILFLATIFNVQVDQTSAMQMVEQFCIALGALMSIVGFVRKVYLTNKK